jgi:putative aldouronate transport system permease protein
LPLSKAIIAVIGLWIAVGHWNSYINALIYIKREELYPLQLILRNILVINQVQAQIGSAETINIALRIANLLRYTVIIAATLPIICVYPFIQKHFNQGVMIGAVKG